MDVKVSGLSIGYVKEITGANTRTIGEWRSGIKKPSASQQHVIDTVNSILENCPDHIHQVVFTSVLTQLLSPPLNGFVTMAELCQEAAHEHNPALHSLLMEGFAQFDAEIAANVKRLSRPSSRSRHWETDFPSC